MSILNNDYITNCSTNRHKPVRFLIFIVTGITVTAVSILFLSFLVQWLWNRTITDIFALKPISYFQSVGILVLSRLLFGGVGNRHARAADRLHCKFGTTLKQKFHRKKCPVVNATEEDIPDDKTLEQYLDESGRS